MDGKSLVLPTLNIDKVSEHARFLILSLPNNEMLQKSPFAIHKAIQGISGEPKSVKKLRSDSKLCHKWKLEKQIQEIKTNKNISYFEARRLIVPQLTQTYAQVARPSTISTASQTDPNLSNIICPPLQCLTPISSKNPLPGTSSSVSTFSTSYSSTQDNLLPSPSGILPTIQSESLLQIPIPTTTTTTTSPGNNLNTLVSPLETETRSRTTPAKLNSIFQLKTYLSRSHNSSGILWRLGKIASDSMKSFVETGKTDMLIRESVQQKKGVLSEFFAPPVTQGVGTTDSKFFVDASHDKVRFCFEQN
ncbi:spondin-2 [Trichonephila clavipes]|nr:spondin-2 [Trichonephila clavipes]